MTTLEEDTVISRATGITNKQLIAAAIFISIAFYLATIVPGIEIAWVSAILLLTIYLFAFEIVGVDVAAITVMVLLGLSDLLAPFMGLKQGLVQTTHLFDGFSSNAVMSIIAVMIIGAGLDKTGIMSKVASFILKFGGKAESRIIPIISSSVGVISSFMQNVGAAALFLPVVSRISARTGLPMSRLLMPMGFCAILGGTITMVGSSPLILLNDLILTSNKALPTHQQMQTWSLFSVTPVGIALVITGIVYFVVAGRFILPSKRQKSASAINIMSYLQRAYGVNYAVHEMFVPEDSPLVGMSLDDIERPDKIRIISLLQGDKMRIGPAVVARDMRIEAKTILGVVGSNKAMDDFAEKYSLVVHKELEAFNDILSTAKAGIGELVLPPGSSLIGKSAREIRMRKIYGISLLALHRGGHAYREGEGVRDIPLQEGDTLVVHTSWESLIRLEKDRDFVVVTTEYPHEELRPHKLNYAILFFMLSLGLVLFSDLRLSVALMAGATGMILAGVLSIEEAYGAVSWKTVFLLASLIPLGLAVETSGTAKWIAEQVLSVVGHMPVWVIQSAVAVLATFFTLVMSNVGATVLLVPLAVNIAIGVGANPAVFALTVALATSNSFLIPTHQVNALIMGPGGYRVVDFIRAGGIMTILFLVVMISMMNVIF